MGVRKAWVWSALVSSGLLLGGCAQSTEPEAPVEADPAGEQQLAPPPDAGAPAEPGATEAEPAPDTAAAPAPTFYEFTLEPTLEGIPDQPAQGDMRGQLFDVKQVLVDFERGQWTVRLRDEPVENIERDTVGGHYVMIKLDEAPAAGKVYEAEAKPGETMWQMPDADSHTGATSYNSSGAYVLEFTDWNVDASKFEPSTSRAFSTVGTASGRIAFNYKGINQDPTSWVAGTFKDAIVRFKDDPNAPADE